MRKWTNAVPRVLPKPMRLPAWLQLDGRAVLADPQTVHTKERIDRPAQLLLYKITTVENWTPARLGEHDLQEFARLVE